MAGLEMAWFIALASAAAWLVWRTGDTGLRTAATLALGAALATALVRLGRHSAPASPIAVMPERAHAVGSGACRACHPSEFASWHRSFHRTMTQVASPATVRGAWDGTRLEVEGRSIELSRHGDELRARLPDPDLVAAAIRAGNPTPNAAAPLVERRVLLATGSHHEQVYWVGGERGNELRLLPITYLIAEERYVPRRDAFLQPPDAPPHAIRWNSNCIMCHATRGEPALDEARDVFASNAVELGIACEACHGPGGAHVEKQRNPVVRLVTHLARKPDPSIVNPARLTPERASAVCGQCHAYFVPRDEDRFWQAGFSDYRPGDALEPTRVLLTPSAAQARDASGGSIEAAAESLFWGDGTIRVGGREFNGLERSACYRRGHGEGRISCLSCHAMHASEPDDQLRRSEPVDAACGHCHAAEAKRVTEHTHHAPGSAGSACVACHMPFTSYALFTAIRSHRIDIPSASATATNGRPNACNLCHLDRSLGWTARTLDAWYGARAEPSASTSDGVVPARSEPSATPGAVAAHAEPSTSAPPGAVSAPSGAVSEPSAPSGAVSAPSAPSAPPGVVSEPSALEDETPRALTELLAGDAATRVVVAAAFGRTETRAASHAAWQARALAELLDDPYAAVRKVACDALRTAPGFGDFSCDFTAPPAERRAARDAALARCARLPGERSPAELDARIDALLRNRDDRPITISE
jgi:Cytochrome c554 and c-prime